MRSLLLITMLIFSACASVEKMKKSDKCEVWEEGAVIGTTSVDEFRDNQAILKGKCAFVFWGCRKVYATLENTFKDKGDIFIDGSTLFETKSKVASVRGNQIEFDQTLLDDMIKIEKSEIDMTNLTVTRDVDIKIMNKRAVEKVEFNSKCNRTQALTGAFAIWYGKAKK